VGADCDGDFDCSLAGTGRLFPEADAACSALAAEGRDRDSEAAESFKSRETNPGIGCPLAGAALTALALFVVPVVVLTVFAPAVAGEADAGIAGIGSEVCSVSPDEATSFSNPSASSVSAVVRFTRCAEATALPFIEWAPARALGIAAPRIAPFARVAFEVEVSAAFAISEFAVGASGVTSLEAFGWSGVALFAAGMGDGTVLVKDGRTNPA
jgi:hypothetical protein